MIDDLKGKAVLITGSSTGIGAAAAIAFGANGAKVAVHYNKSKAEADKVAGDVETAGGKAVVLQGDVTSSLVYTSEETDDQVSTPSAKSTPHASNNATSAKRRARLTQAILPLPGDAETAVRRPPTPLGSYGESADFVGKRHPRCLAYRGAVDFRPASYETPRALSQHEVISEPDPV